MREPASAGSMEVEMWAAKASLAMGLALLCSGCALPQLSVGGDRGSRPLGGAYGGNWGTYPGYARTYDHGVVCDRYGRCWRPDRDDRSDHWRVRPPDWAENLPDSARAKGRFVRPDSGLVCDQATRVCYKRGSVDKSDTKEVFGRRAAKRADRLRDERGTAQIFVPQGGTACDPERRRCFTDGESDRKLTRRHFGRGAARESR
jgi:hypothetical protein